MQDNATSADRQVPAVYDQVLEVVRQIPRGQVATYGQIAMIVGNCTPRMVGYCMASLDPDSDVPWQRVINRQGRISPRGVGDGALRQRQLLISEGVEFSDADRISFRKFGWLDPIDPYRMPMSTGLTPVVKTRASMRFLWLVYTRYWQLQDSASTGHPFSAENKNRAAERVATGDIFLCYFTNFSGGRHARCI